MAAQPIAHTDADDKAEVTGEFPRNKTAREGGFAGRSAVGTMVAPESCAYADACPRRTFRRDRRDRYADATWPALYPCLQSAVYMPPRIFLHFVLTAL